MTDGNAAEHGARGSHGFERRKCPFKGCSWNVEVDKDYEDDEMARMDADHQSEMHFEKEHGGRAKVRVVLEREVWVHPGRALQDVLDRQHDLVDDDPPTGWDVAFAWGEFLKEPDACGTPQECTTEEDSA